MVRRAPTLVTTPISLTVPARNVHARAGAWADIEVINTAPRSPCSARVPICVSMPQPDRCNRLRSEVFDALCRSGTYVAMWPIDFESTQLRIVIELRSAQGVCSIRPHNGSRGVAFTSHRSTLSSRPVGYTCDEH